MYHRLKVELVSRAFARRFSRSRGPIEGEKVKNGDEDFMNVCMITVELYERKQRGNARTRLLCYVDHRVFLTLINYYIVLDTRQRGHTMVQQWYFQSIRQLPRGAAARHTGRFKEPFSLSSAVNSSFSAPLLKCRNAELFLKIVEIVLIGLLRKKTV